MFKEHVLLDIFSKSKFILLFCLVIVGVLLGYHAYLTNKVELLTQIALSNILLYGGLLTLVATGMSLIFGVMKIVNICHGEFIIIGSYVSYWLFTLVNLNPILSIPVSFIISMLLGMLIERGVIEKSLPYGPSLSMLITFCLMLFLQSLMLLFWKPDIRAISMDYGSTLLAKNVLIHNNALITFLAGLSSLSVLSLLMKKTYLGKAIRCVSMDIKTARLMGINSTRINMVSYGIGAGLAGVAGPLVAINFSFEPTSGVYYMLLAFIVVVLSGMGSVFGVFISGLILSAIMSLITYFLGSGAKELGALAAFIIILLIKPSGLFVKFKQF